MFVHIWSLFFSFVAKLEVLVVGLDSSSLTMVARDVIISHKDTNTTYYLRTDPLDDSVLTETHVSIYNYIGQGSCM